MNERDSLQVAEMLQEKGYLITAEQAEADVILINTCSIREKAQEKLFHELGKWKRLKDKNKDLIIGVGGCVASQEGKNILERASCVDIIFGPQTIHRLPQLIRKTVSDPNEMVPTDFDHTIYELEGDVQDLYRRQRHL